MRISAFRFRCAAAGVLCLLLAAAPLSAQDLDPRAYARVPVNGWFLVGGFAWSKGAVLTDPTLPLTDVDATVETPSVGVAHSFYPGTALRSHMSYSFSRQLWAAFDATYYVGGRSTVEGVENNDMLNNSRVGGTLVLPVGRRHSVKLAVSRGAIVRAGADFTTVSVGWQTGWVPSPKPAR
jgi:hypothetical protein